MNHLRKKIYTIIFEADTKYGKLFDIVLLWFILLSVLIVCLESIQSLNQNFKSLFITIEWILTGFFTIEYFLRIISTDKPKKYIFSFFGLIDLLAILPAFIGLFITGAHSLVVIRLFRILRIFRLLKLSRYIGEAEVLKAAIVSSKQKITIFLLVVLIIVVFMGSVMYLIEGRDSGFTSIPHSMYWAIVTMTTVGYGDLAPQTDLGKFLAAILMIMGYAIIAVPTGIITAELTSAKNQKIGKKCPDCKKPITNDDFKFCPQCAASLK